MFKAKNKNKHAHTQKHSDKKTKTNKGSLGWKNKTYIFENKNPLIWGTIYDHVFSVRFRVKPLQPYILRKGSGPE